MTISTILKTVYASDPTDVVRLQTLTIEMPSGEHVRLINGFYPETLGVDGVMREFEPCGINIDLPVSQEGGNQTLKFAIGILDDDRINGLVEQALEARQPVYLVYREYLSTDVSAPAMAPIRMTVTTGVFEQNELGIEGAYLDMLNRSWPRERFTYDLAPGVKYQ